jgi:hypothetical protein
MLAAVGISASAGADQAPGDRESAASPGRTGSRGRVLPGVAPGVPEGEDRASRSVPNLFHSVMKQERAGHRGGQLLLVHATMPTPSPARSQYFAKAAARARRRLVAASGRKQWSGEREARHSFSSAPVAGRCLPELAQLRAKRQPAVRTRRPPRVSPIGTTPGSEIDGGGAGEARAGPRSLPASMSRRLRATRRLPCSTHPAARPDR